MALTTCCCCISLKTGALIIGILSTINYVSGCLFFTILLIADFSDSFDYSPALYAYLGCGLFILLAGSVVSGCLIYGASKERKAFVLPWLIYDAILLFISVIVIIVVGVVIKQPAYAGTVISLILPAYFWFCVLYYYKSLNIKKMPMTPFVRDVQQNIYYQ